MPAFQWKRCRGPATLQVGQAQPLGAYCPYRDIVKQVLSQHAEYVPSYGQIETIPIFDGCNDQYLLLDFGWDHTGRLPAVVLHIRLRDNKVWVERDGTEAGVRVCYNTSTSIDPCITPRNGEVVV